MFSIMNKTNVFNYFNSRYIFKNIFVLKEKLMKIIDYLKK